MQSAAVNGTVARYHTPIQAKGRVYVATHAQLAAFGVGSGNTSFVGADSPLPLPASQQESVVLLPQIASLAQGCPCAEGGVWRCSENLL